MNMRKGRVVFVVLGSLAIIVSALAGQYKVKTENGVTIVTNGKKPDPPKGAPTKLILEEIYTVGGGDAPDSSFVEISALDVLKDGTVYVLDTKDSRVKAFDATGKFLRAFGRAGQGPGELNQPVGILITPENEVLVEDALNQRLAIFALDGTFSRHISTGKALGLSGIRMDSLGRIVARSMGLGEAGKMSMDVKTYDKDLNPKIKLTSFEFPISLQAKINPFSAMNLNYELDGQGFLYFNGQRGYEIKILSFEGQLLKTIGREYDPVAITQKDKDEMLALIPNVSGVNVKDMILFPDYFPPFGNFVLADEGRLLVRTYEKGRAKKEYYWDVFDAEGRYIAKVPIVHEIRLWRDGKAYFIVEDEDGYKTFRCCRARWEK
ncbi:MAG: 6-bladed beta-propeller [Candidatus Aminicenantes bacterium]|nr:MAG: 6-bladed beta-propeller [Candidatus Aminicenantes bacterium]